MASCRNCGAELMSGAEFCMECGAVVISELKTNCVDCGKRIPIKAVFCPYCGTEINASFETKRKTVHSHEAAENEYDEYDADDEYAEDSYDYDEDDYEHDNESGDDSDTEKIDGEMEDVIETVMKIGEAICDGLENVADFLDGLV